MINERQEVIEAFEKHISLWEKEMKALEERIKKARSVLWDIEKDNLSLRCPKGLPDNETICVGCERARPKFWEGRFTYPGGKVENSYSEEDSKVRDCGKWELKEKTTACGCGGKYTCSCGYSLPFCAPLPEDHICPYCGKTCKREASAMTLLGWSAIKKGTLDFGPFKPGRAED